MAKEFKVPVQKGSINPSEPTMKTITPERQRNDDAAMRRDRFDGQNLKFHTPKN